VESFNPATSSWTKKSSALTGMNHFQPVAYQSKIYILQAFSGGGFPDQTNMPGVNIYDTEKDNWQTGAELAADRRRGAAGAALYNGKLYLVNGIKHGHSSGTCNLFDEYDPRTNKWTSLPDAPHIRDHCAASVVNDKLYVAGGRNTSYHEANNFMSFFSKTVLEVDCYDFKTGQWTTLEAKLPLGTGGGSMVNLDGKLYYMGGERATDTEPNAPRKNVYYLDPSSKDQWIAAEDLKNARNGMSAAVLDHKIYVFGGAGGGPGGPPNGRPGTPPTQQPGARPDANDTAHRPMPPRGPQGPSGPSPLEVFVTK
jgi:N-acetylneuraminic acid mutarotase